MVGGVSSATVHGKNKAAKHNATLLLPGLLPSPEDPVLIARESQDCLNNFYARGKGCLPSPPRPRPQCVLQPLPLSVRSETAAVLSTDTMPGCCLTTTAALSEHSWTSPSAAGGICTQVERRSRLTTSDPRSLGITLQNTRN